MERDDALLDLGDTQYGLVDRDDVGAVGLTSDQWMRRVEHGLWREIAPQVWRHRATPDTWQLRARAGLRWLGPDAALYGRTATAWWGIDPRPPDRVEFVVPRARRSIDGSFVVHTTTSWDTRELVRRDGIRLTNATRSIIDLAMSERSAGAIETVIDNAMHRRLVALGRLSRRAAELGGRGRPGSALLRSLLLDSGGESFLERRFLALVRRAGLPRPSCQVTHRTGSRFVARVDFLFADSDIVVEVTGRLGHVSDRDRQRDARRRNELQRAGRVVLEFTTADVLDAKESVIATLRSWLPVHVVA